METWEYKSIKVETKGIMGGILEIRNFDSELNKMGEQGWELVSCFPTSAGQGPRGVIAVFRRKK